MKTFLKALAVLLIVVLAIPALLGAVGALAGFLIAAWPVVLGMVVVAIPGVIVGIMVSKKGGN